MSEAFASNSTAVSTTQMMDALATFLAYDASWIVHKATGGTTTGDLGDPWIFGKTNGTTAEDMIIHAWLSESGKEDYGMNISQGPYDRSPGLVWKSEPGARYGQVDTSQSEKMYCRTRWGSAIINQYYFFGYDNHVWVTYLTDTGIWRNFAFGHINKIMSFQGSAFCCASFGVTTGASDVASGVYTTNFFDVYSSTSAGTAPDSDHCSQVRVDLQDNTTLRYILGASRFRYTQTDEDYDEMFGVNDDISSSGGITMVSTIYYRQFEYPKMNRAPSTFGLSAPLIPIYIYMGQPGSKLCLVGSLPEVFSINIQSLAQTSEITIQGQPYIVFPESVKSDLDNAAFKPNSYHYGYCVRKPV